jgi:hypothetical protein
MALPQVGYLISSVVRLAKPTGDNVKTKQRDRLGDPPATEDLAGSGVAREDMSHHEFQNGFSLSFSN